MHNFPLKKGDFSDFSRPMKTLVVLTPFFHFFRISQMERKGSSQWFNYYKE
jgi:hypothetical protein